MKENKIPKRLEFIIQSTKFYTVTFDNSLGRGDRSLCKEIESKHDKVMKSLDINPEELHEYIVSAEENGRPILYGILDYLTDKGLI